MEKGIVFEVNNPGPCPVCGAIMIAKQIIRKDVFNHQLIFINFGCSIANDHHSVEQSRLARRNPRG